MAAEARFPIIIDDKASEPSRQAADAMDQLRQAIQSGEGRMREYSATLRRLKGDTDAVKKAKDELKGKMNAEQAAISRANLDLHKMGTSYERLAADAKKAAAAQEKAAAAAKAAGAAQSAAQAKAVANAQAQAAKATADHTREQQKAAQQAEFTAKAIAAVAAAVIAVTVAIATGAGALVSWIATTADAARTQAIHSEALLGSAEAARNLNDQVSDIATRVPLAADEIRGLGHELAKGGLQGEALVDSMNAVAQTTAAKGKEAGDKVKKELLGSLGAGAKEARAKAEKELGSLNARGLLGLTAQAMRFKETLAKLASGVNLEPLLRAISELTSFFAEDTVTGNAIKEIVTAIGDQVGLWAEAAAPFIKQAMKQLLILTLQAAIHFLQLYHKIRDAFGPDTTSAADLLRVTLAAMKFAVESIVAGVITLYAVWRVFGLALHGVLTILDEVRSGFEGTRNAIASGWSDLGAKIIDGLIVGLTGGASKLTGAVTGLADKVKGGFKSALGIASPSKVFAEFGAQTATGFEQGVNAGAPRAQSATSSMGAPPSGSTSPASGGGAHVEVSLVFNLAGGAGAGGGDVAKQVTQPAVLEMITKAVEDGLAALALTPERA